MRVKNKIAVSNTSPIMNLDLIDKLDLLKDFYNKILLPEAVWKELSVLESEKIENLRKEGFFEVVKAEKGPFLSLLKKKLDKGESEVICYAVEKNSDIILLDEREGREIARYYRIKKTGVIGILMKAKFEGRITSLKSELDRLKEVGFWIHQNLYEEILRKVGENR